MVDAIERVERGGAYLVAVMTAICTFACPSQRASADPAAAVQVTRVAVPALALGVSHPRVIAAAAPQTFSERITPVAYPFAALTSRVGSLYRDGVEIRGDEQPERLNLLVRSSRGGGALCVRYRY